MQKRNGRKLLLSRETLRTLAENEIKRAAGAATGDTSCKCKIETGCDCETWTLFC